MRGQIGHFYAPQGMFAYSVSPVLGYGQAYKTDLTELTNSWLPNCEASQSVRLYFLRQSYSRQVVS